MNEGGCDIIKSEQAMRKKELDKVSGMQINPIFICGHPKAGTSLLRSLLDSHPELVVYPEETLFFRRYMPQAEGKPHAEQIALAEKLLIHIFQWNVENPPEHQVGYPDRDYAKSVSFDEVSKSMRALLEKKFDHPGDVLDAVLLGFGLARELLTKDTKWWVEKSPYNELFYSQITTWWPEARCIHMVRDPRDNYASYSRKHSEWTPVFFAENWLRSTVMGMRNEKAADEGKYWILRYEDLTAQPEETVQQICAFLGIKNHETLRIPTRNGEAWRGNSMFADQFEEISITPIGRWKKDLEKEDAYIIQTICGVEMESLGYALDDIPEKGISFKAKMAVSKSRIKRRIKKG